jgi:hypothetical protein
LLHASVVIESDGVIAQLMRTIVRGINVVVRASRIAVVRDVDQAVQYALPHVVLAIPRPQAELELKAAIASVRRVLDASLSAA